MERRFLVPRIIFVGVWHLGEDGNTTSDGYKDASANSNDGTGSSMTSSSDVTGAVGLAQTFDGSADYIQVPTFSIATSITASAWVKSSNFAQDGFIIGKNTVNTQWELFFEAGGSQLKWRGGAAENTVICDVPSNSEWHHVVGHQTGTTGTLYIDGIKCDDGTVTAIGNGSGTIEIGRYDTPGYYYNGEIDEVRVSTNVRSADWVKLSYENQKANQSLVGIQDYSTWNHKSEIYINTTVSGANTSANVLDFAYLVRLNSNNFNFSQAQSNGEDIRFSKSNGVHIAYEIERWDATNELAEIWSS